MSIGTVLLVILIIVLLGGVTPWGPHPGPGHFYGGGPYLGGGIGLILLILLILLLLGRL